MPQIEINDTWAGVEGSQDGVPLAIRVRSHLQALIGHPDLPNRLVVGWAYAPDGAPRRSGMPTREQSAALTALEDALVAGLEAGPEPAAVLIGSWTGEGRREWVWYGREAGRLEAALNRALASLPPYPLDLDLEADPEWAHYSTLLAELELP